MAQVSGNNGRDLVSSHAMIPVFDLMNASLLETHHFIPQALHSPVCWTFLIPTTIAFSSFSFSLAERQRPHFHHRR